MEAVLTMAPPPRAFISGWACLVPSIGPFTSRANALSIPSAVSSPMVVI